MAVNNRMVLLSSKDANNGATELIASGGDNNILVGELAINTNDGVLFAGCDPDNASATIGGKVPAAADVLAMTLSTASTTQAVGTGASPTFAGITSTGTFTHDGVGISAIQTSAESFADNDTSLMTSAAIQDKIGAGSGISNLSEDSSPQLGGNLDTNSHNILIDDAHFIGDESGNEQLSFQTTASAVNYLEATNAATGNGVQLDATGSDTNVDLLLTAKGSGVVKADGVEVATLTGAQTLANKTIAASQVTEISNLSAVEGAQLENIDSTTISATQWGYLGAASGAITNTDTDVTNANLLTRLAALESSSGAANENITIGTDSGDTIVITGNLQVSGTTTTVNSTTVDLNDHNIVLDSGNSTGAVVDAAGITLEGGTGDDVTLQWLASGTKLELKKGSSYANMKVGTIEGAFTGDLTGEADTVATIAGLAPNTATTQATQPNITSLGTLTTLQVDNVNINGSAITGSTAADLVINVTDGQSVVVEGLDIDDGVVTGASSITSTTFVGALTGNADTATNLTASTSTAVGVGTINLGHASDTTIARASAGQITVEGTAVLLSGGNAGTPSALVGTNISGTAANLTAGTVTTNANLTGHITSSGNAAVLGSFTMAQLNTAISNDAGGLADLNTAQTLTNKTLTGGSF
tara:strand:- start:1791 stop:3725 length:1935 start_codon:yes stop_codon:yes gene_type:complete